MPNRRDIPGFVPWNTRSNSPGWVTNENGCDIWIGSKSPQGYAQVRIGPRPGKIWPVYRLRYVREIGPIPEGLELDHYVCDNGSGGCCNPHHCRPATHRENLLRSDGVASLALARRTCKNGHDLVPQGDSGYRWCPTCRAEYVEARRAQEILRKRAKYRERHPEVKRVRNHAWP